MARKMLADSEPGTLVDLSSAHICLDCLETLRYLNENQYYMCQHLLPGASIKRPELIRLSDFYSSLPLNPRGALIGPD